MTGVEHIAGTILGGAAKGTASTLLKHGLKSSNGRDSPVSKPEDCFWGADGQLYCPVNKLPGQKRQVNDREVRGRDLLPRPTEKPPANLTQPSPAPWEEESDQGGLTDF
jgi:hypothetical protein